MKRVGLILNAITCCEINADNHCHLHTAREIISKVIFDGSLKVLKNDQPFLGIVVH
jgi:hypothetical protein